MVFPENNQKKLTFWDDDETKFFSFLFTVYCCRYYSFYSRCYWPLLSMKKKSEQKNSNSSQLLTWHFCFRVQWQTNRLGGNILFVICIVWSRKCRENTKNNNKRMWRFGAWNKKKQIFLNAQQWTERQPVVHRHNSVWRKQTKWKILRIKTFPFVQTAKAHQKWSKDKHAIQ